MSWTPPTMLPVTTTGSWARPGWYDLLAPLEEDHFAAGDIEELYRDYAVLAIRDQEECGVDILTDGEVNRKSWIRFIVKKIPNLRPRPTARLLGPHGWDMQETYVLESKIPDDLDTIWPYVDEYAFLRTQTERRVKVGMPGPFGITTQLDFTPAYDSRTKAAEALVPAIRADIERLVAAGCDYIQLEEALTPGVTADDRTAGEIVNLINECVDGISGCTFILHVCFGSHHRLPYAKRTYKDMFPRLLDANVHGFSIEFAAREMSEIDTVGTWDKERILSAGLIDIKTHYAETPEDIVERVRVCMKFRDPERIEISSDCGFRHAPRNLTRRKYRSAAEAARRLRETG